MKPSDSKGFWGSVRLTHQSVSEESGSYKAHTSIHTSETDLIRHAYVRMAQTLRTLWKTIPTASGKGFKRGPKHISVTLCTLEGEYGLTDSGQPKGKRWACKTCLGFAPSVWSDGVAPSREEQEQEWADWMADSRSREVRYDLIGSDAR